MNQLSYYVTKRLIVGSKDSSGTIIHIAEQVKLINIHGIQWNQLPQLMELEWND